MVTEDIRNALTCDNVALVTPSDSTTFSPPRYFSFVTAGDIKVTTAGGQVVVIPSGALAAGAIPPVRVSKIWNTATTAAGIVSYW